mgnify:CR=1 FL=1
MCVLRVVFIKLSFVGDIAKRKDLRSVGFLHHAVTDVLLIGQNLFQGAGQPVVISCCRPEAISGKLLPNLVVAFASAIVPLLVAIVHADYLRHLYGEALAYTPIVGEMYIWLSGFAVFAFLMTLAREMIKDIEDVEGDREMECRTMAIVWGEKWTKIVVTALVVGIMALIAYIGWGVLPFPAAWNTFTCRYLVFGLLVPLACVLVLLWFAKSTREFRTVQQVLKFTMFMGVLFSYVIATNLTV